MSLYVYFLISMKSLLLLKSCKIQTRALLSKVNISACNYYFRLYSKSKRKMGVFQFNNYDCIGFDLDNTLLRYNIINMVNLEYEALAKFLIEERKYNPIYINKPLSDMELDFMQKGLLLDFERGNIMRIAPDGTIKKVSHGTRALSLEEIKNIYPNQRWQASDAYARDMLSTWNGPLSLKIRAILDYFDVPSCVAFARIIDALDKENGTPLDSYNVWPDILDALCHIFKREHFSINTGHYFPTLKSNPKKFMHLCNSETITWIKKLKENSKVFLLTGSNVDFADFTATYALGKDWKSLFDIIICYARKPGFFTSDRPFYALDGYKESNIVRGRDLEEGVVYTQGNWKELVKFFSHKIDKKNPLCLYIGDNLIQDIYVPKVYANCDTVAVVDEQLSEGMLNHNFLHFDDKVINSTFWGSYFVLNDSKSSCDSFWNHVIKSYAKLCVPKIDVFTKNPTNQLLECFEESEKNSSGYYPAKPVTALL